MSIYRYLEKYAAVAYNLGMKTSNKFTMVRIVAAPITFVLYFMPVWCGVPNGSVLSIVTTCILIPFLAFFIWKEREISLTGQKNQVIIFVILKSAERMSAVRDERGSVQKLIHKRTGAR